jgi:magnesium-transporting ATPase (P-type)
MVRIFVKGAPEFMLEVCSQYMTGEESSQTLDQHLKDEIIKNVIKNNFAK